MRVTMQIRRRLKIVAAFSTIVLASCAIENAVQPANDASVAETGQKLFAVEIRTGPNWDSSKPPGEQKFFSEHSANLKHLRDTGRIAMGARYSDIGLIIFSGRSADEIRTLMSQDPSMAAGTFKYEVYPLNVFYPGLVQP